MPVKWLTKEKCLRLLENAIYGRLATCGDSRQPYITPLNFILLNEKIYFHCAFDGIKIDNIHQNPMICFEVSAPGKLYSANHAKNFTMRFWSILIFGTAREISDKQKKLIVLNKIMDKYASSYKYTPLTIEDTKICNIVEITIAEISGKVSVDPQ